MNRKQLPCVCCYFLSFSFLLLHSVLLFYHAYNFPQKYSAYPDEQKTITKRLLLSFSRFLSLSIFYTLLFRYPYPFLHLYNAYHNEQETITMHLFLSFFPVSSLYIYFFTLLIFFTMHILLSVSTTHTLMSRKQLPSVCCCFPSFLCLFLPPALPSGIAYSLDSSSSRSLSLLPRLALRPFLSSL